MRFNVGRGGLSYLVAWLVEGVARFAACTCLAAPVSAAPPVGADGWTVLLPQADTRVVFVSSSTGTDWTEPRWYHADDAAIGGDPFNPVGPVAAYRTLAAAYAVLRDGQADWILLRRGDTWSHGFDNPKWTKSGLDAKAPMLVSSYDAGNGSKKRPRITRFLTAYGPNDPQNDFDHVAIVGIEFSRGLDRVIGGSDFLIEDCFFLRCPISLQGLGQFPTLQYLFDVSIRRSVVYNNYAVGSNAQNLFVHLVDGLNVEECVFDMGGWNPDVPGAEPTQYNHNVYLQWTTTNVAFRRNISARASSHGAQLRRGGICEDNLFLQNPIGLLVGSNQITNWPLVAGSGVVRGNVILDSRNIALLPRGHGMWFEQVDALDVIDNIIAHQSNGAVGIGITMQMNFRDVELLGNIVYDWTKPGDRPSGQALKISNSPSGFNRIRDNALQQATGGEMIRHNVPFVGFEYADNVYWSANADDDLFTPGDTLAGWVAASGETGAQWDRANFTNPERTIESYMASINRPATLDSFMASARKQSKLTWNRRFTAMAVINYIRDGFTSFLGPGSGESPDKDVEDCTRLGAFSAGDTLSGY